VALRFLVNGTLHSDVPIAPPHTLRCCGTSLALLQERTALMLAAEAGFSSVVSLLLEHKVPPQPPPLLLELWWSARAHARSMLRFIRDRARSLACLFVCLFRVFGWVGLDFAIFTFVVRRACTCTKLFAVHHGLRR
jgi:hypothetical protein